jgi:hypothetical protein
MCVFDVGDAPLSRELPMREHFCFSVAAGAREWVFLTIEVALPPGHYEVRQAHDDDEVDEPRPSSIWFRRV